MSMPLAGTAKEKKHYEEIRREYPEKGKEYAARVARNIVRANTEKGRHLKGTTEYGRNWGPPYSKPLSHGGHKKESAVSDDRGSIATPVAGTLGSLLGSVPGGLASGITAGVTAPKGERASRGLITGLGGGLGSLAGAAGGAGLGALGGYYLGDKNRQTMERAALIGAILGSMTGGGLGSHYGRRLAISQEKRSADLSYTFGKVAALQKLGLTVSPLLKLIGRGALHGALGGAIPGAITGAIAAPEGQGWSGALRGGLGGAAFGAIGGGIGGGIAGRGLSQAGQRVLGGVTKMRGVPVERMEGIFSRHPQIAQAFQRGGLGVGAGGLGGGILGGALAAPSGQPQQQQMPNFNNAAALGMMPF
jgi:hypothetical protein